MRKNEDIKLTLEKAFNLDNIEKIDKEEIIKLLYVMLSNNSILTHELYKAFPEHSFFEKMSKTNLDTLKRHTINTEPIKL